MEVQHDQRGVAPPAAAGIRAARGGPAWVGTGLRYCLTAACAAGAGVHAALVQPHLAEAGLPLGSAFAAAAAALTGAALVVRRPRNDPWAPPAAVVTLCLIAAGYLLSRTAGLPLLIAQPEHLDVLGVITTAAELAGAACGVALMSRRDST